MKRVIVTDIDFDLDGEENVDEILESLPKGMELEVEDGFTDEEIEDGISEVITDETGWCHNGFAWRYVE